MNYILNYFEEIVSIITLLLAFIGLGLWRKQLRGTAKYEVAREVSKNVTRVKGSFRRYRNPFITRNEYPDKIENEKEETKALKYVYEQRGNALISDIQQLQDSFIELLAVYGDQYKQLLQPLNQCSVELHKQSENRFLHINDSYTSDKMRKIMRGVLFDSGSKEYEFFTDKIDEACEFILKLVRPYLNSSIKNYINSFGLVKKAKAFDITYQDLEDK